MTLAAPISPAAPADDVRPIRFEMAEFLRMCDDGYFADARYEFIAGEILRMPAQKNDHVYTITMSGNKLTDLLKGRHWVRTQATIKIGKVGLPDPDVAVVEGPPRGGPDMPTTALFVIEVSDTTLYHDRRKASLYALAGVPEYWIINLVARRVEVHRGPVEDPSAEFGWAYGLVESVGPDVALPLPASLGLGAGSAATLRGADVMP